MVGLVNTPVIAIIPARLGSTRLAGKVLLSRTGRPLIQHVYEAAERAGCLSRVVVATEDRKSTRLNSSHLKLSRMPSSA